MRTLAPWMVWVLRVAAANNLLAGIVMMIFYHEAFKLLGIPKPSPPLGIQLVGMFDILMGGGYYLVSLHGVAHRSVLLLGFLSKLFGPLLSLRYVLNGQLPWWFLLLVFVADAVYLPPFAVILWHLYRKPTSVGDS